MINKIKIEMFLLILLSIFAGGAHATIKKLMFSSYDFRPINSGIHQIWNSTYGMRVDWASPGDGVVVAKANFPLGAEFESITCNVYDDNPNSNRNVRVNLLRVEAVNGGGNPGLNSSVIFDISTSGAPGFKKISDFTIGSNAPRSVTNWSCSNGICNYYSYYIYAVLEGLEQSIKSCMVKYDI